MQIKILADNHKRELVFSCSRYTIEDEDPEKFMARIANTSGMPILDDNYFFFGKVESAKVIKRIDVYETLRPANPSTVIYIAPGFGDQIYITNDAGKTIASI